MTTLRDCKRNDQGYSSGYSDAAAFIDSTSPLSSFGNDDLLADVDGCSLGAALLVDNNLSILMQFARAYSSRGAGPHLTRNRFTDFYSSRFGSSDLVTSSGMQIFRYTGDVLFSTVRLGSWRRSCSEPSTMTRSAALLKDSKK